jgi:hypothetical protein
MVGSQDTIDETASEKRRDCRAAKDAGLIPDRHMQLLHDFTMQLPWRFSIGSNASFLQTMLPYFLYQFVHA